MYRQTVVWVRALPGHPVFWSLLAVVAIAVSLFGVRILADEIKKVRVNHYLNNQRQSNGGNGLGETSKANR